MILNIDGLHVACFLDWFKTPVGIFGLIGAVILGLIHALTIDRREP